MNDKKNQIKNMVFLHIILLLYSGGGIMAKKAAAYSVASLEFCFYYGCVLVISVVYAVLWQQILKRMTLVTAFSNKAVTVIWGLIWGMLFFNEKIVIQNVIGATVIIIGVYLVVTGEDIK